MLNYSRVLILILNINLIAQQCDCAQVVTCGSQFFIVCAAFATRVILLKRAARTTRDRENFSLSKLQKSNHVFKSQSAVVCTQPALNIFCARKYIAVL